MNPQGFLHTPLKRARIPIPPLRHIKIIQLSRIFVAESAVSIRLASLTFGLACRPSKRYSIVSPESLPLRHIKFIQLSRIFVAESAVYIRLASLTFGLACRPSKRYSIVSPESLPLRHKVFNFQQNLF